ncbi:hypothetical protein F3Y22_tig00110926pilonHSYRG00075 [Hibiscus syriacus]|uniref:Uncharacterized protein n=1 Tax=Hibiscus syriacus TaxID=106335 RepID=A0A6A2ZDL9_HIBSY|nr:hypothetical protein F3Y22_tig00110926pilonHSYRG00075 [Hibiscus syriacus]
MNLYPHTFGCRLATTINVAEEAEETKTAGLTRQLIPNPSGVESLIRDVCDTTSIAELELKVDSVGYDDALIALLPSFPGIKKLQ